MVEFLAIGAHAVKRSEVGQGDTVLVTGVGPIGIGTALFARLKGADVSLLDLSPERLQMASEKFGFHQGYDSIETATASTNGEGFDVVFDATGHGGAIEAGFQAVAHGGTYTLVSVVKDTISFSDPEFHKREMRVIGSRNALRADFDWVMSTLRDGKIDSEALCSSVISIDALVVSFKSLAADRAELLKVIIDMRE
jgi:threonine dehydrogenase-like Zn-dependent dehydrogenase